MYLVGLAQAGKVAGTKVIQMRSKNNQALITSKGSQVSANIGPQMKRGPEIRTDAQATQERTAVFRRLTAE